MIWLFSGIKQMKNICIVRHGYYPADIRVRKEALALVAKGFKVDIICLKEKNEKRKEVKGNLNIYRVSVRHLRGGISRYLTEYMSFFGLATIMLLSLYLKNRYDFIQVNTLPVLSLVSPRLILATSFSRLFPPKFG